MYSGEQTDAATGLQYLRARYYDPRTGRFNRLDPFAGNINDPQSLHKYLYAHANPVLGSDPSGMETTLVGLSSASSIGATLNSLQAEVGQKALEVTMAVAAGATGGQALVGVLAFDLIMNTVPVLGEAVGHLTDVFFRKGTTIARFLPEVGNTFLRPGILGVDGNELNLLFKSGVASGGNSTALKRNYARLFGYSVDQLDNIEAQFHHITPVHVWQRNPLLKKLNFQVDSALNALPLREIRHFGDHPTYSQAIRDVMDKIERYGGSDAQKRELVLATMTNATSAIFEGRALRGESLPTADWFKLVDPLP